MKITISFTTEEKHSLFNLALNTGNIKEVIDKPEHIVGNFGEMKYDCINNEITLNLKTAFVKASAALSITLFSIIKTFIGNCEMFANAWFDDMKSLNKKENEEPVKDFEKEVEYNRE